MNDKAWKEYFTKRLNEARTELKEFRDAVHNRGLRIWHRDVSGEKDMTASEEKVLEDQVREYEAALKDS
jgi:hypothetical protein